jgi:hypothetical protein
MSRRRYDPRRGDAASARRTEMLIGWTVLIAIFALALIL